jgi:DNA-binding PadR family transcriptional regulator
MALNKDLVAASATPLVLSILNQGESYGYAIIRKVRDLSGGDMEWAEGMLYPILHRLEKKGLVRSHWGTAENGRRRKYYRLSGSGRTELHTQLRHWDRIRAILEELEGGNNVTD